jgi:hypothetical protein
MEEKHTRLMTGETAPISDMQGVFVSPLLKLYFRLKYPEEYPSYRVYISWLMMIFSLFWVWRYERQKI